MRTGFLVAALSAVWVTVSGSTSAALAQDPSSAEVGNFVLARWLERRPEVTGLVYVESASGRLVAVEDATGVTFCARPAGRAPSACHLERGARLVPGEPRWDTTDRHAVAFALVGPRGTLDILLDGDGLGEHVRTTRAMDTPLTVVGAPLFEPPWPSTPETTSHDHALPASAPTHAEGTIAPDWIAPLLSRGAAGPAFVLARADGTVVQVIHGRSSEDHETSLPLVHRNGAWTRGRVRPSTMHGARFVDAISPGAIAILEVESQPTGGLDTPMVERVFALVLRVEGRSLTRLGQLWIGAVSWYRFLPSRSDVTRWYFSPSVDAAGRIVLTPGFGYAGVFDRTVGHFVGATVSLDLRATVQRSRAEDDHPIPSDLAGTYVLRRRDLVREPAAP